MPILRAQTIFTVDATRAMLVALVALAAPSSIACSSNSSSGPGVTGDSAITFDTARDGATEGGAKESGDQDSAVSEGGGGGDGSKAESGGTCESPAPTTCVAKAKIPTSTDCSETVLQDFLVKCIAADFKVPAECAAWRAANAACNTCIQNWVVDPKLDDTKVFPDKFKCYEQIFDAPCNKTVGCYFDCQDAVCATCDQTDGSGMGGKGTEFGDCIDKAIADKGACAAQTKEADKCFSGPVDSHYCDNDEYYTPTIAADKANIDKLRKGVLIYYRGACRDNGVWNSDPITAGDAGSDAPTGG
ncbi:MAG: hypothetical protein NVS3B20_06300 [Polyangiales bacterium]